MSFAPAGMTDDSEIKLASSLVDYIFRRLAKQYLSIDDQLELGLVSLDDLEADAMSNQSSLLEVEQKPNTQVVHQVPTIVQQTIDEEPKLNKVTSVETAPLCYSCGNQTQRAGSCYVCMSCGTTSGCS